MSEEPRKLRQHICPLCDLVFYDSFGGYAVFEARPCDEVVSSDDECCNNCFWDNFDQDEHL